MGKTLKKKKKNFSQASEKAVITILQKKKLKLRVSRGETRPQGCRVQGQVPFFCFSDLLKSFVVGALPQGVSGMPFL